VEKNENFINDLKTELQDPKHSFTLADARRKVDKLWDCYIEYGTRFHNTFFYEIVPSLVIAERLKTTVKTIHFAGKCEKYDAELELITPLSPVKLEMTTAIDGYNDSLQMELLAKTGSAPAFQKIEAIGTKKNREFGQNITNMQQIKSRVWENNYDSMVRVIQNKSRKARKSNSYYGAYLGIVFDDFIVPVDRQERYFGPLCKEVLNLCRPELEPFEQVFFVGVS